MLSSLIVCHPFTGCEPPAGSSSQREMSANQARSAQEDNQTKIVYADVVGVSDS